MCSENERTHFREEVTGISVSKINNIMTKQGRFQSDISMTLHTGASLKENEGMMMLVTYSSSSDQVIQYRYVGFLREYPHKL